MKLQLNGEEKQNKQNEKTIYNLLNNIEKKDKFNSSKFTNNKLLQTEENNINNIPKIKSIFNIFSLSLKNNNGEKKNSPKNKNKIKDKNNEYNHTF